MSYSEQWDLGPCSSSLRSQLLDINGSWTFLVKVSPDDQVDRLKANSQLIVNGEGLIY